MPNHRCPDCRLVLSQHEINGAIIGQCPRCAGTFLEVGEPTVAIAPGTEVAQWLHSPDVVKLRAPELVCPHCDSGMEAYVVAAGAKDSVEVEVCPSCDAIWLDAMESRHLQRAAQLVRGNLPPDAPLESKSGIGWYLFQALSGLPAEAWNPVKAKPVIVPFLIGLLIVVFLLEAWLAAQHRIEPFVLFLA